MLLQIQYMLFLKYSDNTYLRHKLASLEFHSCCHHCMSICSAPYWSQRQICCSLQHYMCSWDDHRDAGDWRSHNLAKSNLPPQVAPERWDSGQLREDIKFSAQLTCAGRQWIYSSSKLPGLVALTSQVVRCWEASVGILKFKAQFLAPVAMTKKFKKKFTVDLLNRSIVCGVTKQEYSVWTY